MKNVFSKFSTNAQYKVYKRKLFIKKLITTKVIALVIAFFHKFTICILLYSTNGLQSGLLKTYIDQGWGS